LATGFSAGLLLESIFENWEISDGRRVVRGQKRQGSPRNLLTPILPGFTLSPIRRKRLRFPTLPTIGLISTGCVVAFRPRWEIGSMWGKGVWSDGATGILLMGVCHV